MVYHGTLNNFDEFIPTKGIYGKLLNRGTASWFSPHSEVGRNYAGKTGSVIEAYLKITNPKIAKSYIEIGTINSDKIAEYKSEGYDGAYFNPDLSDIFLSKENEEYVVFASSQIKSATGNTGSFSTETNDIRFRVEQTIEDLNKINSLPRTERNEGSLDNMLSKAAEQYREKKRTKRNFSEVKEKVREFIQDHDLPIRRLEELVRDGGGVIKDNMKPYRDTSNSYGRNETLYKNFSKEKMEPLS